MRRARSAALLALASLGIAFPAAAQEGDRSPDTCRRAVVVTTPGMTWADVARLRPPNLLEAAEDGAIGSMAVRTVGSRTSYASGFATIGAGTRVEAGRSTGGVAEPGARVAALRMNVRVEGLPEMLELAEEAGYAARPGALGDALDSAGRGSVALGVSDPGLPPPVPLREGRWAHLAAMDASGVVAAATDETVLEPDQSAPFGVSTDREAFRAAIEQALRGCAVVVIDHGDLTRADLHAAFEGGPTAERDDAIAATDEIVGQLREDLDPERDLLLVVSPTSPGWDPETHLGIAIATGPGFEAGTGLRSASTRADGLVTLPDVAPTVLRHLGIEQPDVMLGGPFTVVDAASEGRIEAAVELDDEAVYSHGIQADLATGFVVFQVIVYILISLLLARVEPKGLGDRPRLKRWLQFGALCVVAFPLASYLATPLRAHDLGLVGLVPALVGIDLALVALASWAIRAPLDRLLALTSTTLLVMVVDLFLGGPLQFMAVFGNDPINAGRFAGLGNIAFTILGTCCILTASLLFHRWPDKRAVPVAVAALFVVTVVADGAPQLGSDVGGVLALVPALVVTFLLLTGRRPSVKVIALSAAGAVVALGLFLVLDLSRPPEAQTHLGRFFEDVRSRGGGVFLDTIERKARTNLRIFSSTIWTYLVPPALALIAYLLLRPSGRWRRVPPALALIAYLLLRPSGRWRRLAAVYPRLRAGLIGGLVLAVLGFAVNDSGIVVPAMVLSFLVPMALLLHLSLETDPAEGAG